MLKQLWLIFFISCLHINTSAHPVYKNLVFEGGGIRGIAYAGALEALEQQHILDSVQRTAGTSVGAIVATLVATGYDANALKQVLSQLKIQQFNDGRYIFFGGFTRMNKYYGWYRGLKLEHWIGELIKAKTGNEHLTFRQLHELSLNNNNYKDVYITATNLTDQNCTVFSHQTYPDMEIKTAVRASISIPLYFSAVFLDSVGNKIANKRSASNYDVFVDGGLIANYPISLFDTIYLAGNTLGFKLDRPEQIKDHASIAPYNINSFRNYIGALYNLTLETLNKDTSERNRTVYISTGNIQPRVRKISEADKNLLFNNGITATSLFLSN